MWFPPHLALASYLMRADRHKLAVDEQSFQRLLSAAFSIQEYNDRKAASAMVHRAECAELLNLIQVDPDLNLQGIDAGADEGLHAEVLDLERLLNLPALTIDGSDSRRSKAEMIGEKDEGAAAVGFIPDPDAQQEQIASIAAGQLVKEDDLIVLHRAAVGDESPQDAISGIAGNANDEVDAVPDHLLREIVQQVLQATHATGAAIALDRQGKLLSRAAVGDFAPEIGTLINTGSRLIEVCASTGTMQLCSNTALDRRMDADAFWKLGVSAIVAVPLLHQDQLLGLIAAFSRRPYAFGTRDLQALRDLVENFNANLQVD